MYKFILNKAQTLWKISRVTRLGGFSPIGWLFNSGSFWQLQKQPTFFDYFFSPLRLCISFDKNGLGYVLGDFFTNSTYHPECHLGTQINTDTGALAIKVFQAS
jgi:hypothetical protein